MLYCCISCLKNCLPFIDEGDFFNSSDRAIYELKINISNLCNHKLNLNPFEGLDENFIDNDDIDADKNFYSIRKNVTNDYFDSDQLNEVIHSTISKNIQSILHINARSLVANIDKLQASLGTLEHKFSVIAASETWTNMTNENCIAIPGYDMLVKSRVQGKGGWSCPLF